MLNSFSKFVPFGTAMPKSGISKFSAKVGTTKIRILSVAKGDFFLARTHYLKGVGSFHCFGGSCCQACNDAPEGESNTQERAIFPIAVLSPSAMGGIGIDFMYLALPATKYEQLVAMNNNCGDITQYDIVITCDDEKYQKYTFMPVMGQPSFITPDKQNEVMSFMNRYRAEIRKTLGKDLDEMSFNQARAKALAGAAQSVGVNFTPNATANQVFANPTPQPMPALPTSVAPQPQPQVVASPNVTVAPVVEVQPTPVVVPTPQPVQTVVPPVVEVQPTPVVEVQPTPTVNVAPQPTVVPAETVQPETTTDTPSGATDIDWSAFMNND